MAYEIHKNTPYRGPLSISANQAFHPDNGHPLDYRDIGYALPDSTRATSTNKKQPAGKRLNFSASQCLDIRIHYNGHLSLTAMASGHYMIILEVRQSHNGHTDKGTWLRQDELLPVYDPISGLLVGTLLPHPRDAFLQYYGDNFCHLHRRHLDWLVEFGQAPSSHSALSDSSRISPVHLQMGTERDMGVYGPIFGMSQSIDYAGIGVAIC